jgi:hypothetical protein
MLQRSMLDEGENMRRLRRVCWLLVALLVPFTASAEVAVDVLSDGFVRAGEFEVAINKSQVLKVDQPFNELLISNPEIALEIISSRWLPVQPSLDATSVWRGGETEVPRIVG